MAAKPVIDMVLEVSSIDQLSSSDQALVSLEYESLGENGLSGRRFYQKVGDQRTHHIHAYESGHPDIHRHLVFRDYLRALKGKAAHYELVKLEAAREFRESSDDYAEVKSQTIQLLETEAMLWARS